MLRSPLLSKIQATRGAWAALVRPDGNGALSTCSIVNASGKQQTGKRTETTATQRSEVFTAARLYSSSGAPSNSIRVQRNHLTDQAATFPSLWNAHRGGNAFPFCRQTRKLGGDSGEIAINRNGVATRLVSRRIFERCGQFFLLFFQRRDFHLEVVHALFFFAPRFGNRITRVRFQTLLRFLFAQSARSSIGYRLSVI